MDYLGADTINPMVVRVDLSRLEGLAWLGGYTDGMYPDYYEMKKMFPNIIVEGISAVDDDNDLGKWIDCESGDFTDETAAARNVRKLKVGKPSGTYTSAGAAAAAAAAWREAAAAAAVPLAAIQWWIAEWTGYPHIPTAQELGIPGTVVMCQFAGQAQNGWLGDIDLDWVDGTYLNQMRKTGGLPVMSDSLVMTDFELTATGKGYWQLRSDGAVYSFGDAVYYGGANTAPVPGSTAVSIRRTPSGKGYVIERDTGQMYAYGDAVYEGGHTPPNI